MYTSNLYAFHESVVLSPFPITRFLRLVGSAICDISVLAFLWSEVSKCYIVYCICTYNTYYHKS